MMQEENEDNRQNQKDVIPGSALDEIVNGEVDETPPSTNGTGSNHPVPTSGTVIIKDETGEDEEEGA